MSSTPKEEAEKKTPSADAEAPTDGAKKAAGEDTATEPATEPATADDANSDDDPAPELTPLEVATAKILTLEDEVKAAKDQVLRAMADAENARVIARRDIANEREYAIKNFAKSLLEVADNLERAVESVPAEARDKDAADASPVLLALLEGVEMTSAGLLKAFAEAKVAKVGEIGDKFDPAFHEALFAYEDATKEAGTIGQVLKVGYTLNKTRSLRPAQVGTIKAP